jgi:hypothetical protein
VSATILISATRSDVADTHEPEPECGDVRCACGRNTDGSRLIGDEPICDECCPLPLGQRITLRDVHGMPRVEGVLQCDGVVYYLQNNVQNVDLVGRGHEAVIAAAIVPNAPSILSADECRLLRIIRDTGSPEGTGVGRGEKAHARRLAQLGLIRETRRTQLATYYRLTRLGAEVLS